MPMLWSVLRGLGFFLSAALLLMLSALIFQQAFSNPFRLNVELQPFWATPPGIGLLSAVGAVTLLIALYFLARLINLMTEQKRFVREGNQGAIEVSAQAVEDFVSALVDEDDHLHHARVKLRHGPHGALDVVLNVSLDFNAAVVPTSERLQQRLKDRIEGHLGVEVHRITVYTERLSSSDPQAAASTPQLGHKPESPTAGAEGERYDQL